MLFTGDTVSHTLASVLKDPIDLNALNVPSQICRLLARCLDRNIKTRLRDIGEARIAIDRFLADPSYDAVPAASTAPPPSRRAILPWAFAAAVTLAVLIAGGFALTRPRLSTPPAAVRFQSNIFSRFIVPIFELSPDGRFLAFTAVIDNQSGRWVRPLDSLEPRALPGTEGATYPIWSPDSASLAFFAQGKLKKLAISGGVVQSLCDAPAGRGGAWGPDGAIVFAPTNSSGLFRVSSSGGTPAPLTRIAAAGEFDRYPWFIPGTDRFLYLHDTANPQTAGLHMSSLGGMSPVRVLPDLTQAYFVPDAAVGRGWIVFHREGSVVAQPFDPDHARLSGDPVLLAGSAGPGGNTNKWSFSASATGVLAVHPDSGDRQQIAWVDRTGRVLSRITAPARIQSFALSPDEKRLLLRIGHDGGGDLWLRIWTAAT